MNLTKEKLVSLWRMRKTIFENQDNKAISERFDFVKDTFDSVISHEIEYKEGGVYMDDNQILTKEGNRPSLHFFGCKKDKMTEDGAFNGVNKMADSFPEEYSDLIINIGRLLGGFDQNNTMRDEFRIISNKITDSNDNGSLISYGQVRHPSSHFADNNYFFNVIDTIKRIGANTLDLQESRLVLRWPSTNYYKVDDPSQIDEATIQLQRDSLSGRFPYKFFYMWTHTSDVIHPVSLMAYKNLVQQKDEKLSYKRDANMDEHFDSFIGEDGWREYSRDIVGLIPEDERGDHFMEELSRLLSIIMTADQDIRDYSELLETGNKALILWGPPGTGKTYAAEKLVLKKLGIKKEDMSDYQFEKGGKDDKGQWAIVQFHPNYSYEDFIGGISPKLEGTSLSYCLKEGVFKRFCEKAAKQDSEKKPYIFIIDEINRADLSSVFGELMYALEYRGRDIMLPNFDKPFNIPSNVYIIGTMNSVDKSLTTFDLALRRRFAFFKVMPNLKALEVMLAANNIREDNLQDFIERCDRLNHNITKADGQFRLGEDYQIGHAYFAKIRDFLIYEEQENEHHKEKIGIINSFSLEKLWLYHLLPLLEEYLGSRVEDIEIKQLLNSEQEIFTKSN